MQKCKVFRDLMHEAISTPSNVGKEVEVVAFLPRNSQITIGWDGNIIHTFVNKDVYLCRGLPSRMLGLAKNEPVEVVITAMLGEFNYSGGDVYSAGELGMEEKA